MTIKEEQASALARDYAFKTGHERDMDYISQIENAFKWLSSRFYILDRNDAITRYANIKGIYDSGESVSVCSHFSAQKSLLEILFPGIEKEVI